MLAASPRSRHAPEVGRASGSLNGRGGLRSKKLSGRNRRVAVASEGGLGVAD
jgi:hypothetical protein